MKSLAPSLVWTAVVPVKRLELAKTRLHLADRGRADLALAFAVDTIRALRLAAGISRIVVVTDDRRARHAIEDAVGQGDGLPPVHVVPDVPNAGLNTALMHGAHTAREFDPECGVLAVSADLPALRPDEVDRFLAAATEIARTEIAVDGAAFLSDASGLGTTMLTAAPTHPLRPEFGRRSRAAHRSLGFADVAIDAPGARRDVDTSVDLWDAQRLGVGPQTAAVLDEAVRT